MQKEKPDPRMEEWRFIYATDIHVGSPRSFRFEPAWNQNWETAKSQIIKEKPEFLLLGGDVTRDGSIHRFELENIKRDLDSLPFPSYVIAGNMDTGNKHTDFPGPYKDRDDVLLNVRSEQLQQFSSVFGSLWWSFDYKGVRFSGFTDVVVGSGLVEEREFWRWMELQMKRTRPKHHIWMMHYALFMNDLHEPNYDIRDREQYLEWYFGIDEPYRSRLFKIFKETNADFVISGHVHCRKIDYVDDICFIKAPSTAFPQLCDYWEDGDCRLGFLEFTVSGKEIEFEFIPLECRSTLRGYGPRGHPLPHKRDYSIAWEK